MQQLNVQSMLSDTTQTMFEDTLIVLGSNKNNCNKKAKFHLWCQGKIKTLY